MNSLNLCHVVERQQQQQKERNKEFQHQAHPLPSKHYYIPINKMEKNKMQPIIANDIISDDDEAIENTNGNYGAAILLRLDEQLHEHKAQPFNEKSSTFEGDHDGRDQISQKSSSRATSSTSTGACSVIGPSASALSIWHQHLDKIFNASHHRDDEQFIWHDFTARLLHFVTPRLQHSVQNLPTDWDKVGTILDILYERVHYLAQDEKLLGKDKIKNRREVHVPRPLRILIMGGSVTVGINCANQVGFSAIFLALVESFISFIYHGVDPFLTRPWSIYSQKEILGLKLQVSSILVVQHIPLVLH